MCHNGSLSFLCNCTWLDTAKKRTVSLDHQLIAADTDGAEKHVAVKSMHQNFPTTIQMVDCYNMFLVTGPIILIVAIVLSVRTAIIFLRAHKPDMAEQYPADRPNEIGRAQKPAIWPRYLVATILCYVCAWIHLTGIYGSVFNGLHWRIDPDEIAEIQIEAFRGSRTDMDRIGAPFIVSDTAIIREGFSYLRYAEPFHRQHEHCLDGFRIRLKLVGAKDYSLRYLSIYDRTSMRSGLSVVIPHIGPIDSGCINHAGEYNCKVFHQWFREKILPRINEQQKKTTHTGA